MRPYMTRSGASLDTWAMTIRAATRPSIAIIRTTRRELSLSKNMDANSRIGDSPRSRHPRRSNRVSILAGPNRDPTHELPEAPPLFAFRQLDSILRVRSDPEQLSTPSAQTLAHSLPTLLHTQPH